MIRIFFIHVVALVLFVSPVTAAPTVQPVKGGNTPTGTAAPPAATQSDNKPVEVSGVTRAAASAGVRACLARIDQASKFLAANTQSKALLFLPPADPDRQITSASFELQLPNKSVAYATMSAAPTIDGNCDSLYETVVYWSSSCADVAAKGFPAAKPVGVVQQSIQVLQGNGTLKIFLMPAGAQGCVSIKKEVIY